MPLALVVVKHDDRLLAVEGMDADEVAVGIDEPLLGPGSGKTPLVWAPALVLLRIANVAGWARFKVVLEEA